MSTIYDENTTYTKDREVRQRAYADINADLVILDAARAYVSAQSAQVRLVPRSLPRAWRHRLQNREVT